MSGSQYFTDPSIVLANQPSMPQINVPTAQDLMNLQQQGRQIQGQNALRNAYRNPGNVTPTGGLNQNALRQVMATDPQTGFAAQQAGQQAQQAALDMSKDQWQYAVDTLLTPPQELYDQLVKSGMPAAQAQQKAQVEYNDGLKQAQGSGLFSQDQLSMAPKSFDPTKNAGFLQNWSDYQANQLATGSQAQKLAYDDAILGVDQDKAEAALAGAGLPVPGQGGGQPAAPTTAQPGTQPINNPFNLRPQGASSGFMQYPTAGAGMQAGIADLQAQGKTTLTALLSKYSPPNQNNTAQLIQNASSATGIDPNQQIDMNDPATLALVSGAILKQEGGLSGGDGAAPSSTGAAPAPGSQSWLKPGEPQMSQSSNVGAYTPRDIDFMAHQYLADPNKMPNFGRGALGNRVEAAVMTRVTELSQGDGSSLPGQAATFKSNAQSLANLQKITDSASAYEATANKNVDLIFGTLDKGAASNWGPAFNKWVQSGRVAVGDPNQTAFATSIVTFADEYAKVMSGSTGSTGSTDASRAQANEMLNPNMSPAQIKAAIGIMQQDMANKNSEYNAQLQAIQGRLGGGGQAVDQATPQQSSAAPAPGSVDDGYRFNGGDPSDPKSWTKL